jgi:hypothetical protein
MTQARAEPNKALIGRIFEELWGQGQLELVDELIADNYVDLNPPPGLPTNRETFKMQAKTYLDAFPDLKYTVRVTTQPAQARE